MVYCGGGLISRRMGQRHRRMAKTKLAWPCLISSRLRSTRVAGSSTVNIACEIKMPVAPFESLPDDSRVWVFAADRTLDEQQSKEMLAEVDRFLPTWNAHGSPLTVGRDWRYGRFLTVAVDQSTAGASGCSIDGLFRSLQRLEPELGTSLLAGGRVFWRDADGTVRAADRPRFAAAAREGQVAAATPVFDTSVTTAGDWRGRFERPAGDAWHR